MADYEDLMRMVMPQYMDVNMGPGQGHYLPPQPRPPAMAVPRPVAPPAVAVPRYNSGAGYMPLDMAHQVMQNEPTLVPKYRPSGEYMLNGSTRGDQALRAIRHASRGWSGGPSMPPGQAMFQNVSGVPAAPPPGFSLAQMLKNVGSGIAGAGASAAGAYGGMKAAEGVYNPILQHYGQPTVQQQWQQKMSQDAARARAIGEWMYQHVPAPTQRLDPGKI